MAEVAQHQPEEVRTRGRHERGSEVRTHRRKKIGSTVMSIVGRIPGFGTEGRHAPAARRRAEAVRVPDASQDTFSYDPYTRIRPAERVAAGPRTSERPVVPQAAVETQVAPVEEVHAAESVETAVAAPVAPETTYVPEPSNIRPELPSSYTEQSENYTGRHGVREDDEADIVGQSFEVPVATEADIPGDETVIGSSAWRATQEARISQPTVEHGTNSDPNVIGSRAWHEAQEQAEPVAPATEFGTQSDPNVIGSRAWREAHPGPDAEEAENDTDSDPNVIGSSAWREARKVRNYGPEPRYIDHEIAADAQRKAAAAAELPAVTDESRNVLARVYNNLRSHKPNQGRHAAVGTTGNRRFSFLSRNKGKHRA